MPKTAYFRAKLRNYAYRQAAFSIPANVYVSLHVSTVLTIASSVSDTSITVDDHVSVGAQIVIDIDGAHPETRTVTSSSGSGPYLLGFSGGLSYGHLLGINVGFDPGPPNGNVPDVMEAALARVAVPTDGTGWSLSSAGETVNLATTTEPTIGSNLGVATHLLIWDALTSGNCWEWAKLQGSGYQKLDTPYDPVRFVAGSIQLEDITC